MSSGVPHLFADIRSLAEDMHAIAAEGQCRDNAADMQRVLVSQLRISLTALGGKMDQIKVRLGDGHD